MSGPTGERERAARAALALRGARRPGIRLAALLFAAFLLVPTLALAPRADALSRSASMDLPATVSRANLDGTGKELSFIETPDACGVAVDDAHIYSGTGDGVGRAKLDGTNVDEGFITGVSDAGNACALAVDDEHIYWTDFLQPGRPIGRANLDGSGVNANFISGVRACALAVDSAHLYWVTPAEPDPSGVGDPGSMGRAKLDGTAVNPNFIAGDQMSGLFFGCAVAIDAAHLYWSGGYGIGRADLDGTGINPGFISFPTGPPVWFGMAVDAGYVYWPDPYSTIVRAGLDGTEVNPSFITGGYDPRGVALDARHIYWANLTNPSMFNFVEPFVKRDRKRGTATLFLSELSPGVLKLRGRWVVKVTRRIRIEAQQELPVKPRGKAKKRLNKKGHAKVKAKVTYTPDGGEPNTQSKKIKLVKRR